VEGTGEEAGTGRTVYMDYTGYLADGFSFDSNRVEGGEPLEVTLGIRRVIQGWEQGIPGMRVGGRRTLVIPPELAYGPTGRPAAGIPPNAVLVFDVELLAVD
jgi:FKBP-type peptidyl-prolyl cis-trans isomerase FkpA